LFIFIGVRELAHNCFILKEFAKFANTFACGGIKKTFFNTKELSAVALPLKQAESAAAIVRRIFL